ncbi:MAG: preprotein translocase subunit SecG [Planctomycetes bacterium]|nr:preprotein translocase subunit SecG [Planctomycetota bacterium]
MSFVVGFLSFVFAVDCALLIGIVLLQPHQGEGLAVAFGGGGGGDSFFGTKAISAAARITVILAAVFIGLALFLNMKFMRPQHGLMTGEKTPNKIEQPPGPPPGTPPGEGGSDKEAGS